MSAFLLSFSSQNPIRFRTHASFTPNTAFYHFCTNTTLSIAQNLYHSHPFRQGNMIGFYNHTIAGSRLIINRYYFRAPAPELFCQISFEPPLLNAVPGSECGVNGKHAGFVVLLQCIPDLISQCIHMIQPNI